MPSLVWDDLRDRTYESGLDRGVLYLPDGSAVPWSGLTSVVEKFDTKLDSVYYDGMKINELVTLGGFSATLKAVTYPDEFEELSGSASLRRGVLLGDQPPRAFSLCYRTKVGNAASGDDVSYKIHILFNLIATPSEKTYASASDDPSLVEFEWEITSIPQEIPGFHPTGSLTLDSNNFDPWLFEELETMLYGDGTAEVVLLSMDAFVAYIRDWYRVKIVDNGDGTWEAISDRPGFIYMLNDEEMLFQISHINAIYLDDNTFQITDTKDVIDSPQVRIADTGDGTWTATTDDTGIIVMIDDGTFEIRNVNASFSGSDMYRISDSDND